MATIKELLSIAEKHGTPTYVYDTDIIRQKLDELRESLGNVSEAGLKVFYAMKANSNPYVLSALKDGGANIDAVSLGDIILARAVGFRQEQILFTPNNITEGEMVAAKEKGTLLNVESIPLLEKLGKRYEGSDVVLRFNPMVRDGGNEKIMTAGKETKFGIMLGDIDKVQDLIWKYNLNVIALHQHIGSGITDANSFIQGLKNMSGLIVTDYFPNLKAIDIGGGFKVPYKPGEERIDYKQFGKEFKNEFDRISSVYGSPLELWIEPGKFIAAESGYLLARVTNIKRNGIGLIAGVDSGFNHLVRPVMYDAYHEIVNLSNPEGKETRYAKVVGNLCESGDTFAKDRVLPELREGDIIAINNAGAYGYSMSSEYNTRPKPLEIVVGNGKMKIGEREDENDVVERILETSGFRRREYSRFDPANYHNHNHGTRHWKHG